ncbi:hypothetical protein [Nocardia sp. NPDC049707]|uniref:hypothetical protein n=1 Tax=Nocardia sp. NPDC049707 TaxID=3154735 RepID=UPI00342713F1
MADELRALPERDPEPVEVPSSWLRRDDGTWSAVYPDGMIGEPFSFAQMLAIRGEDICDVIESDTGLIAAVQEIGIDMFDHGRG